MKKLSRFLLGTVACALLIGACNPMDFPSRLTAVLLNEHTLSMEGDSSFLLYITATPKRYTQGDISVTWQSSKPEVVTVSETGSLEALKAGFATIKVTVVSRDVTLQDSCEVMVTSGDIYFADPVFEAYCVSQFDANHDGAVSTGEAAWVEIITCRSMGIGSLEGIEFFPSLFLLECERNAISSLDLSYNHELFHLICYENNLASLNLEQNSKLHTLYCNENALTSLDVSGCDSLRFLICYDNNISNLDVTHNTVLSFLECSLCNLSSLDLSQNISLVSVFCDWNHLTQLDLSNNRALIEVFCTNNLLTVLDVSNNSALNTLRCYSNPSLGELWLRTGQSIDDLGKDPGTEIKYK
ncbi:MAG: Ig-like domain-containing protein [Bacteroidales bacterium]|jgi:hypothetical protein